MSNKENTPPPGAHECQFHDDCPRWAFDVWENAAGTKRIWACSASDPMLRLDGWMRCRVAQYVCFRCEKALDVDIHHAYGGVHFQGSPGYGSRFDCTLATEQHLEIVICDECLEKHSNGVDLVYVSKPNPKITRMRWEMKEEG